MSRTASTENWLAGQEEKAPAVQEQEAAAAVKLQAVIRGRSTRFGGSVPQALGGCAGSGGPAALAQRAAAAQRRIAHEVRPNSEQGGRQPAAGRPKGFGNPDRPLGDWVLDTSATAPSPAQQLSRVLSRHGARVITLFRSWDADSSGKVDKREFHLAMSSSTVKVAALAVPQHAPCACSRAHLASLRGLALPGRGPAAGRPATASGARASRLSSRAFHLL